MNPGDRFKFVGELLSQKSKFNEVGTYNSHSYYTYAGYKVSDNITPYVLYNSTQAGESTKTGDPYFSPIPVKIELLTLGLRYKFNSSFVGKAEYEINNQKYYYQDITMGGVKLDDGFTATSRTNSLRLQLAFVF